MVITIPNEVTEYIQKLFYEWQGSLRLIEYLTAQGTNPEYLKYYTELSMAKSAELEIAKEEVIKEYIHSDQSFDYTFNFGNSCIVCTFKDEQ